MKPGEHDRMFALIMADFFAIGFLLVTGATMLRRREKGIFRTVQLVDQKRA